jgi:hypothetical protein
VAPDRIGQKVKRLAKVLTEETRRLSISFDFYTPMAQAVMAEMTLQDEQSTMACEVASNARKRRSPLLSTLGTLVGPALVVASGTAIFILCGLFRFGSISLALAYINGYSIVAEHSTVSVGEVPAGTEAVARFRLRNLASTPVRVVGAKSLCACIAVDDLPMTVEPGAVAEMTIRFKAHEREAGQFVKHSALLYLDVSSPRLVLTATAKVFSRVDEEMPDLN